MGARRRRATHLVLPNELGIPMMERTVRAFGFGRELRDAAAPVGIAPRLLAEAPEEWRLARLTVVVDRRRDTAQIRYARNPIARARCDAGQVIASCRRALDRLTAESLEPERFAPAIAAAYDEL